MSDIARDPALVGALAELFRDRSVGDASNALTHLPDLIDDALDVQLEVLAHDLSRGAVLAGWKVGLTSGVARDQMGPGVRPFGYITADRALRSGATIDLATVAGCTVEPELCLVLERSVAGVDATVEDMRAAVREVAPAFEIVTPTPPQANTRALRIANRLNHWGIVVGQPVPIPDDLRELTVMMTRDHLQIVEGSTGDDVLDDPFLSLARLCRSLSVRGRGLERGQMVITGSLTKSQPLTGGSWQADFGPIGTVTVQISR